MARQWNRFCSLTVTPSGGGESLLIEGMRMVFEVTKDQLGYANLANIKVYNLSRDTHEKIQNVFDDVILTAGYQENKGVIFKGQIRNVKKIRARVDMITDIWAADGDQALNTGFFNQTFGTNTSPAAIIQKALESFSGIAEGQIDDLTGPNKLDGWTFSGATRKVMEQLKADYGFDWYIQDGKLNVINTSNHLGSEAVLINSRTGMVGSPTVTEKGADCTVLLNPTALVGRKMKIESNAPGFALGNLYFRTINRTLGEGAYKISKVVHRGDTHGNSWNTDLEGLRNAG